MLISNNFLISNLPYKTRYVAGLNFVWQPVQICIEVIERVLSSKKSLSCTCECVLERGRENLEALFQLLH